MTLPYLDAETVAARVPLPAAIEAVETALRDGLDPEADPQRHVVDVAAGQFLLMPSTAGAWAGVKLATVAPDNPASGRPRIQAVYVLLDGPTLTPVALIDGTALTSLRTPAVSAVAARRLSAPDAARLVVFGTGPQAYGHIEAIRAVRPVSAVAVVGRRPERVEEFLHRCRAGGIDARRGLAEDVRGADIVACCTTSREPLFDGAWLPAHACVLAVGSHEPRAREVDSDVVRRSTVFVESRASALREAGDLLIPLAEGAVGDDVIAGNLAELVTGGVTREPDRPALFKSVGMSWEDLVVAAAAATAR